MKYILNIWQKLHWSWALSGALCIQRIDVLLLSNRWYKIGIITLRSHIQNGPLVRYVKLWVAHAPGMPRTFPRYRLQRKPLVSDSGMHVGWWWGKLSRHSQRMRNPQCYISGKRPMASRITNSMVCSVSKGSIKALYYSPFVRRMYRWPMVSPHKGSVIRQGPPCHDAVMLIAIWWYPLADIIVHIVVYIIFFLI